MPSVLTSCQKEDDTTNPGGNTPVPPVPGSKLVQIDLTAAANAALANKDGFVIVSNIIVLNTGSDNYIALSSVCTHSGCTVSYSPAEGNFPCYCHGSLFAQNGSVLNGPASQPLKVYKVTKSGNTLTIE